VTYSQDQLNDAIRKSREDAFAECIEAVEQIAGTTKYGPPDLRRILDSMGSRSGNDGKSFAHREYQRGVLDERIACRDIAINLRDSVEKVAKDEYRSLAFTAWEAAFTMADLVVVAIDKRTK